MIWFALQFMSGVGSLGSHAGGVAYWAHIGGFVAGLVLVFAFVITNLVVDLAYAILDPRVTLGSRAQ